MIHSLEAEQPKCFNSENMKLPNMQNSYVVAPVMSRTICNIYRREVRIRVSNGMGGV